MDNQKTPLDYIIDPFTNVPYTPPPPNKINDPTNQRVTNVQEFQMGSGDFAIRGNEKTGFWIGAKNIEDAPLIISPDGKITIVTANLVLV